MRRQDGTPGRWALVPFVQQQIQESATQLRRGIAHALGKKSPDDPGVVLVQACLWGLSMQHLVYQQRTNPQTRAYVNRLTRWLKTEKVKS